MVTPGNSMDWERDKIVNALEERVKSLEDLVKRLEDYNKNLQSEVNSIWIKIDCNYC